MLPEDAKEGRFLSHSNGQRIKKIQTLLSKYVID